MFTFHQVKERLLTQSVSLIYVCLLKKLPAQNNCHVKKEVLKTLEGMGFSGIEIKHGFKTVLLDDLLHKPQKLKKFMKKISLANIFFNFPRKQILKIPKICLQSLKKN